MKKRAQLVCQHLENISREALERHQEIIRQYVRGRQGVYALNRRLKETLGTFPQLNAPALHFQSASPPRLPRLVQPVEERIGGTVMNMTTLNRNGNAR